MIGQGDILSRDQQQNNNSKNEVNRVLYHVDLETKSRRESIDEIQNRWRQQIQRLSNGNSPIQQMSQNSPKFQENEQRLQNNQSSFIQQQLNNSRNSLGNITINRSASASQAQIRQNRYHNLQSFSPIQNSSIQEEYYLRNQNLKSNPQFLYNGVSNNTNNNINYKYTPDKRKSSLSPSPFKISELQTTQFNINASSLDVKNSKAYLKAMKALQNKVKEIENIKKGEMDALKKTLEEKEQIINDLNDQIREQQESLNKAEKKLSKEVDIFGKLENNLKGKLKVVEKENDEYIQHCNFYSKEIESLKEKIISVEQISKQEIKALMKDKAMLKEQINAANSEEAVFKQKIKDLQQQNNNLIQNIESIEIRYRHLEQSFKQQINDNGADIKQLMKQLHLQLLEKDDQINKLHQDNLTLNSDLILSKQKVEEYLQKYEDEKKRSKHLEGDNKDLCDKISDIIKDNENMRSFCQATRDMNNKLLNSFTTNRLNETQANQTMFKSGSQNQHSFSQSGHFYPNQSLIDTQINQNMNIQDEYQQYANQKSYNRNSSSNLLSHISAVAVPSQKTIPIQENIQYNQQAYFLNSGLSLSNQNIRKDDLKSSIPKREEGLQENQEIKQYNKFSQSQALTSSNSLKQMQQYTLPTRSQNDENHFNLSRQRSFNVKDSSNDKQNEKKQNFSEHQETYSQDTFRTKAQISVNQIENIQQKSRYEYEQVIQAVLDTEKQLVELNHTYQKLAEDTYNYQGEEIYITVLKKKLIDLKEKIERKESFLLEMKNRENVLAQSILSNIN